MAAGQRPPRRQEAACPCLPAAVTARKDGDENPQEALEKAGPDARPTHFPRIVKFVRPYLSIHDAMPRPHQKNSPDQKASAIGPKTKIIQ
jgi:hypothetical protein